MGRWLYARARVVPIEIQARVSGPGPDEQVPRVQDRFDRLRCGRRIVTRASWGKGERHVRKEEVVDCGRCVCHCIRGGGCGHSCCGRRIEAAQSTTGPIARYDMRAGTTSGLGAMGGGMKGGFGMAMGEAVDAAPCTNSGWNWDRRPHRRGRLPRAIISCRRGPARPVRSAADA
jgi:hypothetical protein